MINYISSYKVNFVSPAKALQLAGNMPGEKHKAEIYAMYEKYKEDKILRLPIVKIRNGSLEVEV